MKSRFRSIRKKLFTEGKLLRSLGYAAGEIALIIIGILFALQISNWNEDRKAQAEFELYLRQLKADVEQAISNANVVIGQIERDQIARFNKIIPFLERSNHDSEETENFESALRWLGVYPEVQIHSGFLGQLLDGNMEVISRDRELARHAMLLESRVEYKMAIIHHNYDWIDGYHSFLSNFRGGIAAEPAEIHYDLEKMRASSEFAFSVESINAGMKSIRGFTARVAKDLQAFLAVLEEYE